ncbi:MAG: cytochrome B [Daejeonella sp.]|uniref:cytochrome B n=1 Tax=Daejeonella sp. JGW-45 TaxID=3034148 RepID=UPI0023EDB4F6|nr:cytochrome B [Daejeonella sp. JGW-45]
MYNFFLGLHSGLRYIVLLLLAVAIVLSVTALFGKKDYTQTNRKINLFAMIATHTQLLAGLILYFFSPLVQYGNMGEAMKNTLARYWTVEHAVLMLFAVALITVGHSRSKKDVAAVNKHRAIALYYGLAILVIVIAIYQSGRPLLGMTSIGS